MQAEESVAGAEEIHHRLLGALTLATSGTSDSIFYTRTRVKDPKSLAAKILDRQDRYRNSYTVSDATDIVGLRLVVLYDDQLITALDIAIHIIINGYYTNDKLIDSHDIFKNVYEIKIFPRHDSSDDPYIEIFDELCDRYPKEKNKKIKIDESRENEYSSLHIIVYMNTYALGYKKRVPVEIQIRTAVEDIWAEISHKNKYKIRRKNIWSPKLDDLYSTNANAVGTLKRHLDAATPDIVRNIRKTTNSISEEIADINKSKIARYQSTVLNLMYVLGHTKYDNSVRDLFGKYDSAVRATRNNQNLKKFGEMKELLSQISEVELEDDRLNQNIRNLAKFESLRLETVALRKNAHEKKQGYYPDGAVSKDEATVDSAKRIYRDFDTMSRDPSWDIKPIALIELWKYFSARYADMPGQCTYHLSSCLDSLPLDPTLNRNHVLYFMCPRMVAYEQWKMAETNRKIFGDSFGAPTVRIDMVNYYQNALRYSLQSDLALLEIPPNDARNDLIHARKPEEKKVSLNNKVFYASECINHGGGDFFLTEVDYSMESFEFDVRSLVNWLNKGNKKREDLVSHSVMLAHEVLNEVQEAKAIAIRFERGELGVTAAETLDERIKEDIDRILRL